MVPVSQRPSAQERYPLALLRCTVCSLVQQSVVLDPEVVFASDFPYSSGNSRQLHANFEDLAQELSAFLDPDDLVVDIGANDGTLLSKFDCRTVGVEPTNQVQRISGPAYQAFFDESVAKAILAEHGPAKLITACNVLAHVADPHAVMQAISLLLEKDGLLVSENHDVSSVLAGQWDMVYHEHLRFYSPFTFSILLRGHGLGCQYWHQIPTHGGSFRMVAIRGLRGRVVPDDHVSGSFDDLQRQALRVRSDLRSAVNTIGPVRAIGATARGTTILNYCGLDVEEVECVCEVPQSDKIGYYMPGTRIPIVDEARLFGEGAEPGLLLSWHLADLIIPKLRTRAYGRPIIVPLPEVKVIK